MKSAISFVLLLVSLMASGASASVFLPKTMEVKTGGRAFHPLQSAASKADFRSVLRQQRRASKSTAMAIPGYGVVEQVFVGGFQNFLSIVSVMSTRGIYCTLNGRDGRFSHPSFFFSLLQYNAIITARILLSWFPQAQGIGLLQPVYSITGKWKGRMTK